MSRKLSVHIEVTVGEGREIITDRIADSIPDLIRAHYGDIDVTVIDAITSSVESEYALTEQ